jgi:hypothetical protein
MLRFLGLLALVRFLIGPALAGDCLPAPTAACLQEVAIDALIDEMTSVAEIANKYDRLLAWNGLEDEVVDYVATLAAIDNMQAVERIIAALPPDKLRSLSMRLVLTQPRLSDVAPIAEMARSTALAIHGPGYGTETAVFDNAIEVLVSQGEMDIARTKATAAVTNFFVLKAQYPDDDLSSEKGSVVGALLFTGELSAAQAFLEKAEPKFENAYQWMVVAKAGAEAGDCEGAMALTARVPQSERARMGNDVLEVIYRCRGLAEVIAASSVMPDQELGIFATAIADAGNFDDAVRIAGVMKARQSWWEDSILRDVARAELQAGAFDAARVLLQQQASDPYESARSRIELSMAMARNGRTDTALLKAAIVDLRALDRQKVDPYSMADMMLLAGFAQTWLQVSGPEFISLDEIETQIRRLSPDSRDDPFGQLEASEEGIYLAIATVAFAEAMGQRDRAAAFQTSVLPAVCENTAESRVDCSVAAMQYIRRFAAPGRMGNLPARAWALAVELPDPAAQAHWAWEISWYLDTSGNP